MDYFLVIVVTCICVLCGLTIGSRPCRVSMFHTLTLSEFYIICICDVVLVLCLPMLSLTVVLRQRPANPGPRAKFGPRTSFNWPAWACFQH